jgi:hypothetical protein
MELGLAQTRPKVRICAMVKEIIMLLFFVYYFCVIAVLVYVLAKVMRFEERQECKCTWLQLFKGDPWK